MANQQINNIYNDNSNNINNNDEDNVCNANNIASSRVRLINTYGGKENYGEYNHGPGKHLLKCCWSKVDVTARNVSDRIRKPPLMILAGGSGGKGSADVYAWDFKTQKLLYKLSGHAGDVTCVDFHPKEPIIGSCGSDGKIFLGEIDSSNILE